MPERLGRVLSPKVKERKQTDMLARQFMAAMPVRNLDLVLAGCAFFLVGFGILMIYSATRTDVPGNPTYFVMTQFISLILGIILMALFMVIDYRRLKVATPFIYGTVIFLLVVVFFTKAARSDGSRSAPSTSSRRSTRNSRSSWCWPTSSRRTGGSSTRRTAF